MVTPPDFTPAFWPVSLTPPKSQQSVKQWRPFATDNKANIYIVMEIYLSKQECIPVGCIPPARYRTVGMGLCPGGGSVSEWLTDSCRNITFPQLRLRAVIRDISDYSWNVNHVMCCREASLVGICAGSVFQRAGVAGHGGGAWSKERQQEGSQLHSQGECINPLTNKSSKSNTVTISSRGPHNLSNFLFERQKNRRRKEC